MTQKKWRMNPAVDLPNELLEILNQDKILANYLFQRGIQDREQIEKYLNPDIQKLSDPFDLPDMGQAVKRITRSLKSGETIGIWGDFDVDGQTATAILVECLTQLGGNVYFHLPVRGKETHGISIPYLDEFLGLGIHLLITCDTGITAHDAIRYAKVRGIDSIITDHHTLPEVLPSALACINPHRLPEAHSLSTLSGSAAAFELMLALSRDWKRDEIALNTLDLAALGLVADLAHLQGDARLITQLGLRMINQNPRSCIQEIRKASKMQDITIDEQTIGFTIAPRLNAYGRLGDANPLVNFLMDKDETKNKIIAIEMERFNADRRWLTNQVFQSASELYKRQPELIKDPIIILSNNTWRGGVLGLAAGHLSTDLNKPVILLNESQEGKLHGSARSVEGVDITEALTNVGSLLESYGGHSMAAGLSLSIENLLEFRRAINLWVTENNLGIFKPPVLDIDAELTFDRITPEFFGAVEKFAPFGNGNPPLTFIAKEVQIESTKPLGRNSEHFKFILKDANGYSLPAVWWGADPNNIPKEAFDLAFTLRENQYKGKSTLQAEWIDFHLVETKPLQVSKSTLVELTDLRHAFEPMEEVSKLLDKKDFLIYKEPPPLDDAKYTGRIDPPKIENLVLCSIPPSMAVLETIIINTRPRGVILAVSPPTPINWQNFLKHLSELIKYAVEYRNGLANLEHLAEAIGCREETIEAGIEWLQEAGKLRENSRVYNLVEFSIETHPENSGGMLLARNKIEYQLNETYAFQKHIFTIPKSDIQYLIAEFLVSKKFKTTG